MLRYSTVNNEKYVRTSKIFSGILTGKKRKREIIKCFKYNFIQIFPIPGQMAGIAKMQDNKNKTKQNTTQLLLSFNTSLSPDKYLKLLDTSF